MVLKIYNTLSREKEEFKPLHGNKVGMYVCGVTPYDYCHLGHARAYITFDMVFRYLQFKGYEVKYVQNFTDVDDKIINKARKEGDPFKATKIAARFIEEYYKDMDALGVLHAHVYPKVSEHIPEIINLIQRLIKRGFGYEIDGDVYYDVSKFKEYGKLSKLNREQMKAGARIEVDERKRNPEDFALWKKAKPDEPYWDSPWGKGRPGWHIECSAMSMKYLGETFDIHGGGMDLIFPHHENEIAQSEGATGKPFVKYWLHNGFITVDQEKMSKSLGNFFTIRDVMKKYSPEAIRFFILSTHYRSPIDFSDAMLANAENNLKKLHNCIDNLKDAMKKAGKEELDGAEKALLNEIEVARNEFIAAMDDDFNTPVAIATIFELTKKANTYLMRDKHNHAVLQAFLSAIVELGGILHLFREKAKPTKPAESEWVTDKLIELIIALRQRAREKKDFKTSDEIRQRLAELGVVLEDQKDGTVGWKRTG